MKAIRFALGAMAPCPLASPAAAVDTFGDDVISGVGEPGDSRSHRDRRDRQGRFPGQGDFGIVKRFRAIALALLLTPTWAVPALAQSFGTAQTVTDVETIDAEGLTLLWCAEYFYEEAYWYDLDPLSADAYAAAAYGLELEGRRVLAEAGSAPEQIDGILDRYRQEVEYMSEFAWWDYEDALWNCEIEFGSALETPAVPGDPAPGQPVPFPDAAALSAEDLFALAQAHHLGQGVPHDLDTAMDYYSFSAVAGHAEAQYVIALAYQSGIGIAEDAALSAYWMEKAASRGHADAQREIGLKYHRGEGAGADPETAAIWLNRAALDGDARAAMEMASLGIAVPRIGGEIEAETAFEAGDYALARRIWLHHALGGSAVAQTNLGMLHADGHIAQDDSEAAHWYRLAAAQGFSGGQVGLGILHDMGRGVPQDHVEAARLYRLAADQGHVIGQYNLGLSYEYGEGVERDPAQAAAWMRRAADQEYDRAQHTLGRYYRDGVGVDRDLAEARRLFGLAAAQGHGLAQGALDALGI